MRGLRVLTAVTSMLLLGVVVQVPGALGSAERTPTAAAVPLVSSASTGSTGPRRVSPDPVPSSPVFTGLGAWVDRYDYAIGRQQVTPATVDVIADSGVQTLYLQAATPQGGTLLAPARQKALIARAKARGLRVVSWYLPTTKPLSGDMRRIKAMVRLEGVDGFGIDAESKAVGDVDVRNQRLIELLRRTRALTGKPIGLITPSPTALDLWAPKAWPDYPFEQAAAYVDAYLPMTYWAWHREQTTAREQIVGDVERLRSMPAVAAKPIHVVGLTTWRSDARTLAETVRLLGVSGGSLYDWLTTPAALRKPLRGLRR